MSKDIKFRIWNKMDRKFYTYNKLDTTKWLIDMDGNLGYMDLTDFSWGGLIPKGFYQINQYTGLKDKNGKEIYEGDIVKQTFHKIIGHGDNEENFEGYHIGQVVLVSSGVCIKKPLMYEVEIDQLVKLDGYKNVAGYRSEVIGNIYENPELLEGK